MKEQWRRKKRLQPKTQHESCPFIPPKQLALYANPRFWQYGLLAFIAGCCKFNNQHRRQAAATTKTALSKQEKSCERDVDALTFMQTVVMSFVRGMEFGEQTLPTNDLFVYLPVQLLPALVGAINQQGFRKAGVESGVGYRPRKDGAEDNPLLVAGVYCKEVVYNRYPRMPDTSWAERAYTCGALDPSLGRSMSFPSVLLFKLRIEIPLWRDHVTARRPPADLPAEESETDADDHGSTERSPRFAPPVPVGVAEPQATETEALAEEEEEVTQPTYKYAQGYGRFEIRYTRLATALGNFEQGDVQTEGAVVASWLTSGLRIAMSRAGWRLLSPRHTFTRVTGKLLVEYYCKGYPLCQEEDRPYHRYGDVTHTEVQWDRLCAWLSGDPEFRKTIERRQQRLREQLGGGRDEANNRTKARRIAPPLERSSSSTARASSAITTPPHRGSHTGGGNKARTCHSLQWLVTYPARFFAPPRW